MSIFRAEVVRVSLTKCPNSDYLSLASVKGWQCVVRTEQFVNEKFGVFIPVDTAAAPDHPFLDFLKGEPVRTIRLKDHLSEGILLPLSKVQSHYDSVHRAQHGCNHPDFVWHVGSDVTSILKIRRYQPEPNTEQKAWGVESPYAFEPDWFSRFTDIENVKNFPDSFRNGEWVEVTLKMNGVSARYAKIGNKYFLGSKNKIFRTEPITVKENRFKNKFLNKILPKALKIRKKVALPPDTIWHEVYDTHKIKAALDTLSRIYETDRVAIYGEIVGTQTGYHYGLEKGDLDFYVYDIRMAGANTNLENYLNPNELGNALVQLSLNSYEQSGNPLKPVPLVYYGPYSKHTLDFRNGDDPIGIDHVREGIIIKPDPGRRDSKLGRVVLKAINEDYSMDNSRTDY